MEYILFNSKDNSSSSSYIIILQVKSETFGCQDQDNKLH